MADGQEIIPITYRHCNCREFCSELNGGRIEISPVLHPSHDLLDNPNHVSSLQLPRILFGIEWRTDIFGFFHLPLFNPSQLIIKFYQEKKKMADGQEIIPITYRHCNCLPRILFGIEWRTVRSYSQSRTVIAIAEYWN